MVGVLSSLFWCLTFDEVLTQLNEEEVYVHAEGYGDDIVITDRGKFKETVAEILQRNHYR